MKSIFAFIFSALVAQQTTPEKIVLDLSPLHFEKYCEALKASENFKDPNIRSDYVEVPEDWSNPEKSEKIKVFYYYKAKTSALVNPVLVLNGGPAWLSHAAFAELAENKALDRDDLTFVFMDQRGTGCSTVYPSYKSSIIDETLVTRLARYSATNIVKDSEAIRKKLVGENAWRILGSSYGAYIALRYLELYPKSLLSAHAHGGALTKDIEAMSAHRIIAQNEMMLKFLDSFPDGRKKFETLKKSVSADTCITDGFEELCGALFFEGFAWMLKEESTWPEKFDRFIEKPYQDYLAKKPYSRELLQAVIQSSWWGFEWDYQSRIAMWVLWQVDLGAKQFLPNDPSGCELVEAYARKLGSEPKTFVVNDCRLMKALYGGSDTYTKKIADIIFTRNLYEPFSLSKVRSSLEKFPEVKFYLYASGFDTVSPPSMFKDQVEQLGPYVKFRVFEKSAHHGVFSEEQILKDLTEASPQ